uniref:RHD domain-containing protein n=1 Tax=Timema genevievae TaxID=629358 RepID=A0A7R9K5T4_TIMGE|nr:unnamed protein product [Timema genevievae]
MWDNSEFNIKFEELVECLSCHFDINNDDYHQNQIQERSWSKIAKYIGVGVIMNTHSPPGIMGVFSPESMSASSSDNSQESTTTNHSSPSSLSHYTTIELQDLLRFQSNNEGPCLVIREEPVDRFRFRYKSEMIGTHGSILGRNSEKMRKKSYPTVELCNYNGSAIIRCTLCTFSPKGLPRSLHTHRLVVRQGNEDKDDPHDIVVSPDHGYIAVFQGMGIIHTAKKNIVDELIKKKRAHILERIRCQNPTVNSLSVRDECNIRKDAELEARKMNLNSVSLRFEAFRQDENGRMVELCNPVYSCAINNMKSALTGELKICRIDRHTSSCYGGDEIFILVEKVGKKNLKIKFFELDDEENEVWCDYGRFSELDVHHQYAVVFRTPPYRDMNIDRVVDVFVQLLRPSDGDCSEPVRFQYKPSEKSGRKRHRMSEDSLPLEVQILNNTGINNLVNNLSLENTAYLPPAQARTLFIDPEEVMMHHNSNPKLPHIDDTVPELFQDAFNDGEALTSSEFKEYINNLSLPSGSLSEYISTLDPSELDGPKSEDMDLTTDSARGTSRFKIPTDTLKKGILSVRELLMTKEGGKQGVSREKGMTNKKVPNKVYLSDIPKTVVKQLTEMLKERPPPKVVAKIVEELFHSRSAEGYSPLHFAILMNLKDSLKVMLSVLGKGRHTDIINARDNNKEVGSLFFDDF